MEHEVREAIPQDIPPSAPSCSLSISIRHLKLSFFDTLQISRLHFGNLPFNLNDGLVDVGNELLERRALSRPNWRLLLAAGQEAQRTSGEVGAGLGMESQRRGVVGKLGQGEDCGGCVGGSFDEKSFEHAQPAEVEVDADVEGGDGRHGFCRWSQVSGCGQCVDGWWD